MKKAIGGIGPCPPGMSVRELMEKRMQQQAKQRKAK